jgi:hypothetical protein
VPTENFIREAPDRGPQCGVKGAGGRDRNDVVFDRHDSSGGAVAHGVICVTYEEGGVGFRVRDAQADAGCGAFYAAS